MNNNDSLTEKIPHGADEKRPEKEFFSDILKGFMMGIAFIIPGFSGGSVAAILGIYEKLINAIAGIFKSFKKSFMTLLPIAIGLFCGVISLLFPLRWALEAFPIPTVSLFVGLAVGALPSVTEKTRGKITGYNAAAFVLPAVFALGLCFLPIGKDADLLSLMPWEYFTLFLIGAVGSSALVIPGISGSMILLILGYYNPIVSIITDHLLRGQNVLTSLLVLTSVGVGIIVGFIGISVIMKHLLSKYPRGTYFAILGFIIGSLPTVFVSTAKDSGLTLQTLPASPLYWTASALLLLLGAAVSLSLIFFANRQRKNQTKQN